MGVIWAGDMPRRQRIPRCVYPINLVLERGYITAISIPEHFGGPGNVRYPASKWFAGYQSLASAEATHSRMNHGPGLACTGFIPAETLVLEYIIDGGCGAGQRQCALLGAPYTPLRTPALRRHLVRGCHRGLGSPPGCKRGLVAVGSGAVFVT